MTVKGVPRCHQWPLTVMPGKVAEDKVSTVHLELPAMDPVCRDQKMQLR